MTTTLRPDAEPPKEGTSGKAVWTRPILDVVDVAVMTQAGGAAVSDQDPNQPMS